MRVFFSVGITVSVYYIIVNISLRNRIIGKKKEFVLFFFYHAHDDFVSAKM
jgi:hypothetical protein